MGATGLDASDAGTMECGICPLRVRYGETGSYDTLPLFVSLNVVPLGVGVVQRLGGAMGAHTFLTPADRIVRYSGLGFAFFELFCAGECTGVEVLRRVTGQVGSLRMLYPDIWPRLPNHDACSWSAPSNR